MNTTFSPLVALVGNPNCGKTALFNRLTGARQKVANFAGVTVERKIGKYLSSSGRSLSLPDNTSPKPCRMRWSAWLMPPICGADCVSRWN